MDGVWITWELQRRNKGISSALGWDLYEIVREKSGLVRYALSIYQTTKILLKRRPRIVGAQNPSLVLALWVILLKRVMGYVLVIDAHNSGLFPAEGRRPFLMRLARFIQKQADMTLITNNELAREVRKNRGRGFVLPDRIPRVPETRPFPMDGRVNVVFVCSFSEDEPFEEVLQAAQRLPEDVVLHVTGKYQGHVDKKQVPSNVRLLGFIPDAAYWNLLDSADLIVDLTTREGCLVCGAYEGIALGKPLVLSDTAATRDYFNQGCVYVAPTVTSITDGIEEGLRTRSGMVRGVKQLRRSLAVKWDERLNSLERALCQLASPTRGERR